MAATRDKKELDRIGQLLIERAAVKNAELDALVAKPALFAGVADRIQKREQVTPRRFSLKIGLAYASVSLSVAVIAAAAAVYLMSRPDIQSPAVATGIAIPATQPDTAATRPASPPQDVVEVSTKPPAGRGYAADREMIMPSDRATVRPAARPAPRSPQANSEDPNFYAVSYADHDAIAGGRIVRVDMPRAQAFAMGLPVSLENESDTVKADVLVGPDGVPRGVRLVK